MNIWKKLRRNAQTDITSFLKERENYCVSAISRYNSGTVQNVWAAFESNTEKVSSISALLLYGKRLLFPVFHFSFEQIEEFKKNGISLPLFLSLMLKSNSLHAAQGLADDMDLLENALKEKHIIPVSMYDYELRSLDYAGGEPSHFGSGGLSADCLAKSPPDYPVITGLVIRRAEFSDADALFPLQAAYEKEEVLPKGAGFNPALCRKILESLITEKTILTAELKGKLVGKININAQSYNRFQIGGVYVLPEYRSRGIARAMTTALIREFLPKTKHFTLFVKKTNIPARRVYDSLGFTVIGDYRISYFF